MAKEVSTAERVAYHEAGHAVAAYHSNPVHKLKRVTIVATAEYDGCNHSWPKPSFRPDRSISETEEIRTYGSIVTALAGAVAERRRAGKAANLDGSDSDFRQAFELANRICGDGREVNALIAWLQFRAQNLIRLHYRQVKAVAKALLQHQTLDARAVRKIIEEALLNG